jgi:hypothetical protein
MLKAFKETEMLAPAVEFAPTDLSGGHIANGLTSGRFFAAVFGMG